VIFFSFATLWSLHCSPS